MPHLLQLLVPVLLLTVPADACGALVFAFEELPPWKTVRKGSYGGVYVKIVRELGRRLGVEVEMVNCPLKRCMFMLEHGTADIAIGYKATPDRRRYLHFLATPYRTRTADRVFYVMLDRGIEIQGYGDLAGLRVGVKRGAQYLARFDSDTVLIKAVGRDMETNFRKLTLGRVDTVMVPEDQGDAIVARLGLGQSVAKAPFRQIDASTRSVAVSLRSPFAVRIADFEQAMAAMVKDGTLDALYRRHDLEHPGPAAHAAQVP